MQHRLPGLRCWLHFGKMPLSYYTISLLAVFLAHIGPPRKTTGMTLYSSRPISCGLESRITGGGGCEADSRVTVPLVPLTAVLLLFRLS